MHTTCVAALVSLIALAPVACGSKKDKSKSKPKPAATQPSTDKSTPDPAPQEMLSMTTSLKCGDLLKPPDIEKECGTKVADWKIDPMETLEGAAYCSRRTGPNGGFVRLMVGIYPHVGATRLVTGDATATKPMIQNKRAGGSRTVVAHARLHNISVSVRGTNITGKPALCTPKQLGNLAVLAASRLP